MKKAILTLSILATLTASVFAYADNSALKAEVKAKADALKAVRVEMKMIREQVQVVKLTERSKKIDEQMAAAQAKLAEMKKTITAK